MHFFLKSAIYNHNAFCTPMAYEKKILWTPTMWNSENIERLLVCQDVMRNDGKIGTTVIK